jgi:hypothetical protein
VFHLIHHGGVAEADERAWVAEATALLRGRFGDALRGWHSPAHSESHRTPDLVAGAGYGWTSGWANDDMPYAFATKAGDLTAMPRSQDLSDQRMLQQQKLAQQQASAASVAAKNKQDAGQIMTALGIQRQAGDLRAAQARGKMTLQQQAQKMEADRLKAATEMFYLGKKLKAMSEAERGSQ